MSMMISAKYYQKNKENLHKKTREKYQNLFVRCNKNNFFRVSVFQNIRKAFF